MSGIDKDKYDDNEMLSEFLMADRGITRIAEGVHTVAGQGNTLLIETAKGLVITDTGPGRKAAKKMIAQVREFSDKPLLAIVYSHGHLGYNFGAQAWLKDAAERGHPVPQIIAHERVIARYDRYQETWGLQCHLNNIQFGAEWPDPPREDWFTYPTVTLRDSHVIDGGDRQINVLAAPSETDDATAVWVADCQVLYAGPGFIKSIPNIGTPLRTLRDPVRWADTMEKLQALKPKVLVPEFGGPVKGETAVHDAMQISIDALRYLRRETVRRMNQGMTEWEILHDIEYPETLFGHPLMKPSYGLPDYIVRDIWRSENGWWDRNPTHLHPAEPAKAAQARRSVITEPQTVLDRAQAYRQEGQPQLALHVLDLLALDPADDEYTLKAKALKAELLEGLAETTSSFVSAQIYRAEAKRLAH